MFMNDLQQVTCECCITCATSHLVTKSHKEDWREKTKAHTLKFDKYSKLPHVKILSSWQTTLKNFLHVLPRSTIKCLLHHVWVIYSLPTITRNLCFKASLTCVAWPRSSAFKYLILSLGVSICLDHVSIKTLDERLSISTVKKILTVSKSLSRQLRSLDQDWEILILSQRQVPVPKVLIKIKKSVEIRIRIRFVSWVTNPYLERFVLNRGPRIQPFSKDSFHGFVSWRNFQKIQRIRWIQRILTNP